MNPPRNNQAPRAVGNRPTTPERHVIDFNRGQKCIICNLIDRLNETYLQVGKVKFNRNFIDCNLPQGLTREETSHRRPDIHYLEHTEAAQNHAGSWCPKIIMKNLYIW